MRNPVPGADEPEHGGDPGRPLREAREAAGLSRHGLAKAAHVDWSVLARWERAGRCPHGHIIAKVANALGIDPAALDPVCWQQRPRTRYGDEPAGAELRALRRAAGLAQREVAASLSLTTATISHWETGRRTPPPRLHAPLRALYQVAALPLPAVAAARQAGMGLRALRVRAGLAQQEAARAVGITPRALRYWEQQQRAPPPEVLARLAALYGVAPEVIARDPAAPRKPPARGPVLDGTRLAQARRARGWTQRELAERMGVSQITVARWETERRAPRWAMWERITTTLGMSIDNLAEAAMPRGVDEEQ